MTVWLSAWLSGSAASDDVLDALERWGDGHDVVAADDATAHATGLPAPEELPTSLTFLLAALRRRRTCLEPTPARLLLAVPGDVRGLPGPGPFAIAALESGEGVLFDELGVGLVPRSLGGELLRWTLHELPGPVPAPEYQPLREAEYELRQQVRESATTLASLGIARHRPGVREEIAESLRARRHSLWPDGMPPDSLRVLQHADEVEAILEAASVDDPGGALSASAAEARGAALRPLATAVRMARRAAVAEAVRSFARSPGRR
jgi:hypothetical protein